MWTASPPDAELRLYRPEPFAASTKLQWPNLAFAPDGKSILAVVNIPAAGIRYFLLPWPAGAVRMPFPNGLGVGITPRVAWLPDSRHVVFLAGPDLRVADTASGQWQTMAALDRKTIHPALSPDGSRLAYQSSLSHTDVVSVPIGEGPVRSLLDSPRSEEMAACSPVEEKLVYSTDRRGRWEVWISSFDRQWERPLLEDGVGQGYLAPTAAAPVFSPDGQRVAFRVGMSASQSGILVAPAGGGAAPQIIVQTPVAFSPQWSPDGEWLVFVHLAGASLRLAKVRVGEGQTPVDLGVVTGGNPSSPSILPEWSPTGEWIALGDEANLLKLVSSDGKRQRKLGGSGPVAWARDGKTLYQMRITDRTAVEIDISSGKTRKLRDLKGLLPYATREPGRRVSLTPDGKSLVFSVLRPREEIWLFDGIRRNATLADRLRLWMKPAT